MGFPITFGGNTFVEADFSGMGYTTEFLDMLDKLAIEAKAAPYGTSTTSLSVSAGSKTLTIETGRRFPVPTVDFSGMVRVWNSSTNYMEGTITAYDPLTGVMQFLPIVIVGAGTYTAWNVVPSPGNDAISPLFYTQGAVGGITPRLDSLSSVEVPELYHLYSASGNPPQPWYFEVDGDGLVNINGNISMGVTQLSASFYSDITETGDKAFLSYGEVGFFSMLNAGDIFSVFKFSTVSASAGEEYVLRIGLMPNYTEPLSDQAASVFFGLEVIGANAAETISYLARTGEDNEAIKTVAYTPGISTMGTYYLRYNHLNREVTVADSDPRTNLVPNHTVTLDVSAYVAKLEKLGGEFRAQNLLRPFFYFEKTSGVSTKSALINSLYTTQKVRR